MAVACHSTTVLVNSTTASGNHVKVAGYVPTTKCTLSLQKSAHDHSQVWPHWMGSKKTTRCNCHAGGMPKSLPISPARNWVVTRAIFTPIELLDRSLDVCIIPWLSQKSSGNCAVSPRFSGKWGNREMCVMWPWLYQMLCNWATVCFDQNEG